MGQIPIGNSMWIKGIECKVANSMSCMKKERWLIYTVFSDVKNNVDGRFKNSSFGPFAYLWKWAKTGLWVHLCNRRLDPKIINS